MGQAAAASVLESHLCRSFLLAAAALAMFWSRQILGLHGVFSQQGRLMSGVDCEVPCLHTLHPDARGVMSDTRITRLAGLPMPCGSEADGAEFSV